MILDEQKNDLDVETIDLLIEFINLHEGSALISSHDVDFLKKTCDKFFIFDGLGSIQITKNPNLNLSKKKIDLKEKQIIKKEKPINTQKLISRILKKIETKETYINDLTKKLQKFENVVHNDPTYIDLVDNLRKAQNELEILEKEWIEIEENANNER